MSKKNITACHYQIPSRNFDLHIFCFVSKHFFIALLSWNGPPSTFDILTRNICRLHWLLKYQITCGVVLDIMLLGYFLLITYPFGEPSFFILALRKYIHSQYALITRFFIEYLTQNVIFHFRSHVTKHVFWGLLILKSLWFDVTKLDMKWNMKWNMKWYIFKKIGWILSKKLHNLFDKETFSLSAH